MIAPVIAPNIGTNAVRATMQEIINAYEKHEKKREAPKAPRKFDGKYRRKT